MTSQKVKAQRTTESLGDLRSQMDDVQKRLNQWLASFGGPGWKGREAYYHAIEEMRAFGSHRLAPLLISMLADSDPEVRCRAAEAILWIDDEQGIHRVSPLFHDKDTTVRWHVCGLMHDLGDERAVELLIDRMKNDPDPQVRGTAAYALGGIGGPRAIPAVTQALETDHASDELGYTPSFCAREALSEIDQNLKRDRS